MDPKFFSAKSFKNTSISNFRAAGASLQETATAGRHRSVTSSRHYLREVLDRKAGGLTSIGNPTIQSYDDTSLRRNLAIMSTSSQQSSTKPNSKRKRSTSRTALSDPSPPQKKVRFSSSKSFPSPATPVRRSLRLQKKTRADEQSPPPSQDVIEFSPLWDSDRYDSSSDGGPEYH